MDLEQEIALGNYLSEYPDDLDYDTILQTVRDEGLILEGIVIAEAYENFDGEQLADEIEGLRSVLERRYGTDA